MESSIPKSQQGVITYPKIYPLRVKEVVEIYNAHAKLKHFFKCNAILDNGLELQINEDRNYMQ